MAGHRLGAENREMIEALEDTITAALEPHRRTGGLGAVAVAALLNLAMDLLEQAPADPRHQIIASFVHCLGLNFPGAVEVHNLPPTSGRPN